MDMCQLARFEADIRNWKSHKIKGTVDRHPIQIALMPNGQGDHMLSLNKTILKKINKQLGDTVTVFIEDTV